ncbi:MAG TPA: thioredoxin fold domain-containing protein [Opitutaceae bacterium]|nr:thioredoxin fold domain-containing protein [Opitutaceae bacterium]
MGRHWKQGLSRRTTRAAHGVVIGLALLTGGCRGVASAKTASAAASSNTEPPHIDRDATRRAVREALDQDRLTEAVALIRPLAEQGDADALFVLGFLHDLGAGADWDAYHALKLIRVAATKRHVGAQMYLAWKYKTGFNVVKDTKEAERIAHLISPKAKPTTLLPAAWMTFSKGSCEPNIRRALLWMQTAATDKDPIAEGNLADVYLKSEILPANLEYHVFWLMKAADAGNPRSAYQLSKYYRGGILVQQDKSKSLAYLKEAATGGWPDAQADLAQAYEEGDSVSRSVPQAREWFEKAANNGNAHAMVELGQLLRADRPTSENLQEALRWFREAAKQDNPEANEQLGLAYLRGIGTQRDLAQSIHFFETAARLGSVNAKCALGKLYLSEFGDHPDLVQAQRWLNAAAAGGSAEAMAELGLLSQNGNGIPRDDAKAFDWYEKAARLGNGFAQMQVANCFWEGRGVARDPDEALEWIQLAIENGEQRAHGLLETLRANGIGEPRKLVSAAPKDANGAPAASLNWMTDFHAAEEASGTTHRPVLLNFTGSDWCVWCSRLRNEVFAKNAFASYAQEKLILVEVDFPRAKQQSVTLKEQNAELARKYGIENYPTIVLVDANGRELGRTGYMQGGPKTFLRELRKILANGRD